MTSAAGEPEPDEVAPPVTTLDVVENFFGKTPTPQEVNSLQLSEIDELRELVLHSASAQAQDFPSTGTYYLGAWVAGNWLNQSRLGDLYLALLYYPRLLVHDPLAEFFFGDYNKLPKMRPLRERNNRMTIRSGVDVWLGSTSYPNLRDNLPVARVQLTQAVGHIVELAPLIRDATLIMRSQWPVIINRRHEIMTSVRHDVSSPDMQEAVRNAAESGMPIPLWDNIRGLNVTPASGLRLSDLPWHRQFEFFFLAKTLAVADQAGALYVPPEDGDLSVLRTKSQEVAKRVSREVGYPIELLREVKRVVVPDLQLDAKSAVEIRKSEESFDDWRRFLSSLAREAKNDTPEELAGRVEDQLIPIIRQARKTTQRSETLKSALKEQSALVAFSIGTSATTATFTDSNAIPPALSLASWGVLQWLWRAYRPPKMGGTEMTIASLLRGSQD